MSPGEARDVTAKRKRVKKEPLPDVSRNEHDVPDFVLDYEYYSNDKKFDCTG